MVVGPGTSTTCGLSTKVEYSHADGVRRLYVVNLDDVQFVSSRLVRGVARATPETLRAVCATAEVVIDCPVS